VLHFLHRDNADEDLSDEQVMDRRKRIVRIVLLIIAGLLVVVTSGIFFFWPKVSAWRQDRDLRSAQSYERSGDIRRALLTLEQVVQIYPDNLEARRQLASTYERTGQKQALIMWQEVMRLDPGDVGNQLGYAGAALRFGEKEAARPILERVRQSGSHDPEYYRLAAGLALADRNHAALEENLTELARLLPQDLRLQLNLAVIRLRNPDGPQAAEARATLIVLARNDALRIRAIAELFADIARRWPKPAVDRTAAFQNLVQGLTPAKGPRLDPPEIGDPVERLFAYAMLQPDPVAEDVAVLLQVMVLNGRAAAAFEWIGTLPVKVRRAPLILTTMADASVQTADWRQLRQLLLEGAWGAVPPAAVELAFQVRGTRDGLAPEAARTAWARVLVAARASLPGQVMLLRLCDAWGWPEERKLGLQAVTHDFPLENWAWQQLLSFALSRGEAEEVSRLYQRWIRARPADMGLQVRAGIMDLLLQQRSAPTSRATAGWMQRQPDQPDPVVAHALALWRERRGAEALPLLKALPAAVFAEPRYALVYGLVLAELGRAEESEVMLNRASADRLLPDERLLAEQARSRNQARLTAPRGP
jgi:tetratricopeptide (TPR) repeat protein